MDRQNSLFDAVLSKKLPEPKAKQRKSKEKKRSYSIGKPEVTKSVPEIPKVINRLKRRNPPCDAPLCVVSSFFPMGKEERGGAAQGGFLLLGLFIRLNESIQQISVK